MAGKASDKIELHDKHKAKIRRSPGDYVISFITYVVYAFFAFVCVYPFYYINYTLTTMGAMEFKKKYAENREAAWEDYLNLCKVGGSMSYLETLRHANLSVPFEDGAVARATSYAAIILLRQIEELEEMNTK